MCVCVKQELHLHAGFIITDHSVIALAMCDKCGLAHYICLGAVAAQTLVVLNIGLTLVCVCVCVCVCVRVFVCCGGCSEGV